MRLIIEPNYEQLSKWAANYVIERINAARTILSLSCLVYQQDHHQRGCIPNW